MTPAARVQAAIELLDEIARAAGGEGAPADTLIARYFKTRRYAGSKDRRAVRELVYAAIRLCAERPASGRAAMLALAEQDPDILPLFDGSTHGPAHVDPDEERAEAGVIPRWLAPLLADPLVDPAEQAALLERAPLDLRVNRLKADAASVREMFPDAQTFADMPDALRLMEGTAVEDRPAYRGGFVEIQDLGSQMIVTACGAQPGMTVIDLCAGAGGKTLGLASEMGGEGTLIAADVNRERLSRLAPRAERAGAGAIGMLLLDARREAAALEPFQGAADVVLVDAPCSGTGTWRRNPEGRWRLTRAALDRYVTEQARILDLAAPLVKSGGRLVYAVCSLTRAEGQDQAQAFLSRHTGWKSVDSGIPRGRELGAGRLLTPRHDGTDGFYIAVLLRT